MTDPAPDRPLVTFALFAYNQEQYIREAVEGAFSQTYEPLEIILSDDCSSDRTFEIMEEMAAVYRGPHQLRINRNSKNIGLGSHINYVANLVEGSFLVLAAGDDVSYSERVAVLTNAWLKSGRQLMALQSGYRDIDQNSKVLKTSPCYSLPKEAMVDEFARHNLFIVGATGAYDIQIFRAFPPLNANVVHEDRVLPFRALLLGGEVGSIDKCLVDYRKDVGISASYRNGGKMNRTAFSSRVLSDNLQKMIDAQHTDNSRVLLYLAENIKRYTAEVYAGQMPINPANFFCLLRHAGLFWGTRAAVKYLLRS